MPTEPTKYDLTPVDGAACDAPYELQAPPPSVPVAIDPETEFGHWCHEVLRISQVAPIPGPISAATNGFNWPRPILLFSVQVPPVVRTRNELNAVGVPRVVRKKVYRSAIVDLVMTFFGCIYYWVVSGLARVFGFDPGPSPFDYVDTPEEENTRTKMREELKRDVPPPAAAGRMLWAVRHQFIVNELFDFSSLRSVRPFKSSLDTGLEAGVVDMKPRPFTASMVLESGKYTTLLEALAALSHECDAESGDVERYHRIACLGSRVGDAVPCIEINGNDLAILAIPIAKLELVPVLSVLRVATLHPESPELTFSCPEVWK